MKYNPNYLIEISCLIPRLCLISNYLSELITLSQILFTQRNKLVEQLLHHQQLFYISRCIYHTDVSVIQPDLPYLLRCSCFFYLCSPGCTGRVMRGESSLKFRLNESIMSPQLWFKEQNLQVEKKKKMLLSKKFRMQYSLTKVLVTN